MNKFLTQFTPFLMSLSTAVAQQPECKNPLASLKYVAPVIIVLGVVIIAVGVGLLFPDLCEQRRITRKTVSIMLVGGLVASVGGALQCIADQQPTCSSLS